MILRFLVYYAIANDRAWIKISFLYLKSGKKKNAGDLIVDPVFEVPKLPN